MCRDSIAIIPCGAALADQQLLRLPNGKITLVAKDTLANLKKAGAVTANAGQIIATSKTASTETISAALSKKSPTAPASAANTQVSIAGNVTLSMPVYNHSIYQVYQEIFVVVNYKSFY